MSTTTSIEWAQNADGTPGVTWNPVVGCDKVSAGCDLCYAETIATRFAGTKAFPNGFAVTLHPERIGQPLRWKTPKTVFVNSMSDLFHADVPDEFLSRVFATMSQCPQHTFQILTKRHGRMRSTLRSPEFVELVQRAIDAMYDDPDDQYTPPGSWPLPNVHLGVSVENQQWADIRIPALLETPAAVRWLSCEPLLGPIDLREHIGIPWNRAVEHSKANPTHVLGPYDFDDPLNRVGCDDCGFDAYPSPLSWVVVGGESGHGARPMDLEWVRDIRDQCAQAGVPLFIKQLGSVWARENGHRAKGASKGQDMSTWPEDLRVRQMPERRELQTV